jgi:putative hydrolase of the HAD superfamily
MSKRLTWIFDLDNTLHNATPHVFPHISRSMTAYLREYLDLDEAQASALRVHYWKTYGATLVGLMRHHGTDPRHFLWHTHQFPALKRMVIAERGLRHALRRIRGPRILFSNSPLHYAQGVLDLLRIGDLFDAVYCIERTGFRPKPSRAGFRVLLERERLMPGCSVLVEDTLGNLRAARRLGLKTVWVTREQRSPPYVDVKIASILALPHIASRMGG